MDTYVNDITVIVLNSRYIDLVGTALKEYKVVTGENLTKKCQ